MLLTRKVETYCLFARNIILIKWNKNCFNYSFSYYENMIRISNINKTMNKNNHFLQTRNNNNSLEWRISITSLKVYLYHIDLSHEI
jgi:hypothetical protein